MSIKFTIGVRMKKVRSRFNNNVSIDSHEKTTIASTSNQIVDDQQSSTKSKAKVGLEASSLLTGEGSTTSHEKFLNRSGTIYFIIYILFIFDLLLTYFLFYLFTLESSSKGKKARGPTRNLKLVKLPHGIRFEVSWRNKRPVGDNADIFKSQCTILARQVNFTPLQVKSWRDIDTTTKRKLFELTLVCEKIIVFFFNLHFT